MKSLAATNKVMFRRLQTFQKCTKIRGAPCTGGLMSYVSQNEKQTLYDDLQTGYQNNFWLDCQEYFLSASDSRPEFYLDVCIK